MEEDSGKCKPNILGSRTRGCGAWRLDVSSEIFEKEYSSEGVGTDAVLRDSDGHGGAGRGKPFVFGSVEGAARRGTTGTCSSGGRRRRRIDGFDIRRRRRRCTGTGSIPGS